MAKYRDTYQCYGLAIKADKMSPQKDCYLLLFKVNVLSNAYRVQCINTNPTFSRDVPK